MNSPTIVKLGGSAITVKSQECTPNLHVIYQSVEQIASYRRPLILLHGGGSYGHPRVTKARLHRGYLHRSQLTAIAETELFLDQLTRIVGVSLLRKGRPFVPLRPMSFVTSRGGEISEAFLAPIKAALKIGLIPLIHGDLAFDSMKGISVISADRIASLLGVSLAGSRVLFGCDVDGVFSENPRTSPKASLVAFVDKRNADSILRRLRGNSAVDATEGMLGKVKESIRLARRGHECYIFNLTREGELGKALQGNRSGGTTFLPWK